MATPTAAAAAAAAATAAAASTPTPAVASETPSSAGEAAQSSSAPVASKPEHAASEEDTTAPDAATDEDEAADPVPVPRCSTWFSLEAISPIEKRMLPEFFAQPAASASKTAQIYLRYRNYMVQAYRQQPSVYLTATACRRNLAGDACAILRVHEFLSHWGLINFHVPPHAMPAASHPNYSLRLHSTPTSSDRTPTEPVAMLVSAKQASERRSGVALGCEACGKPREDSTRFFELSPEAKSRFTSAGAAASSAGGGNASSTPMGSAANGKQSSSDRKELTVAGFALRPGSGLCEDCYLRGAFPQGSDATDFVRARATTPASQWTEEETTRLLEAVSASGPKTSVPTGDEDEELAGGSCDWNFVAAKVGSSKTADDCLLRFLELPLLGQPSSRERPATTSRVGAAVQSLRPFAAGEALNQPVLDLSALLQQADPLVAKAAAQAAISAIRRLHTMSADVSGFKPKDTSSLEASAVKEEDKTQANGAAGVKASSSTSFEEAAEAVKSSADAAGVGGSAAVVKSEPTTTETATQNDGDVAMEDVSAAPQAKDDGASNDKDVGVTVEAVAVAEEAASATTAALVAVRAQKLADATAKGPVRELVRELQENQLRQMELKMQQLDILERSLAAEREQLAKDTYQLYVDRLAFAQKKLEGQQAAGGGL